MLAPTPIAGIDVGKHFLDLGFEPAARARRVTNDAAGIAALIAALRGRGAARVALEAIGPYAWPVTAALVAAGFEVRLADPRQVRAFRTAEGRIAKTDRLDAGLIARFAGAMPQRLRPAPEPQTLALKALSTRRRQLVELVAMEKTRLGQAFDATIAEGHRIVIAALEAACKEIEARLDAAIAADPALVRRREILVSIPGVGPRIAGILIADMPELGALDRKAAASLAGLAPHPDQSGRLPGRNAISGGRPCLTAAFYMAGMVAARCDPRFRAAYRALRDAGKPPKVAIIATGRRLATIANALIREDITFEKSRFAA
ncbi:MAG: IS110 family transposase [Amaricoccus sp.]|nr:IS110 family transposase [Amaricoccus sp.]